MEDGRTIRKVETAITPIQVMEGAGVRLRRSIATRQLDYLDPFLLFDHFGSEDPQDYLAGFPLHPHRGIETVTYLLSGEVHHADSIGNSGSIKAGDVQWMTAGGGIMHEEMPQLAQEPLNGFQLWVNLPAPLKMCRPRYQDVPSQKIPTAEPQAGVAIRVIAGEVAGVKGPVTEIAAAPQYFDVSLASGAAYQFTVGSDHTAFAYLYSGSAAFGGTIVAATRLAIFGPGDTIAVEAGTNGAKFLLVSGKPLGEPIARYGPFVMNTEEEIRQALHDLRNGTFVMKP
jgi:redox-sensitive bicupin YhaK (pirin superfamily)